MNDIHPNQMQHKMSPFSNVKEEGKDSFCKENTIENEGIYYIESSDTTLYKQPLQFLKNEHNIRAFAHQSSPISTGLNHGVLSLVRSDLRKRPNVNIRSSKVPNIEITIPNRSHNRESSPTLINTTAQEREYNIKTLNTKRNLNQRDLLYQTYTQTQNENYHTDKSDLDNNNRYQGRNNNNNQYTPSEPMIIGDNEEMRLLNMKNQISQNSHYQIPKHNEGYDSINPQQCHPISLHKSQRKQLDEGIMKTKESFCKNHIDSYENQNRINGKLSNCTMNNSKMIKDNSLIANPQMIIANNDNDYQYQSLSQYQSQYPEECYQFPLAQKSNNKISNVLYTKTNNDIDDDATEQKETNANKAPKQKFLFLSLAMIKSKGPNCEDNIILRKMRFDKGGVVDFAQEANKSKGKYPVMKITRKRPPLGLNYQKTNPKCREKAAKIVQSWWKNIRKNYQMVYKKIVLIQSTWRGKWIRKYMYDLVYMQCLCQTFNQRIAKALVNHVRLSLFPLLKTAKNRRISCLYRLFSQDIKYCWIKIRPYWDLWRDYDESGFDKSGNSNHNFQGTNRRVISKEEKFKELVKAFGKYRNMSTTLKDMKKVQLEEDSKKKEKGLLRILQNEPLLLQRTAFRTIMPHLTKHYLAKTKQQAIPLLRNSFVKRSKTISFERLQKEFYRWKSLCFARKFLGKLKEIKKNKEKYIKLKIALATRNEIVEIKNQQITIERIYKLYFYTILNKFINRLIGELHQYKIPFFKRLANQMLRLSFKNFEHSYIKSKPSRITLFNMSSLNFKARLTSCTKPITNIAKQSNSNSFIYYRLLPFFIIYLQKKFNANMKWAAMNLALNCKDNKFCSLYKKCILAHIQIHKRLMIERLIAKNTFIDGIGIQQIKLFVLLRKSLIRSIHQLLIEPSHFYLLKNLIKMTMMHKEVKQKRFEREVIRKWHFMSFIKKMAKRKLQTMYQNLHSNFMQMTNEVFGDSDKHPGLINEVENFEDKIGMFTSEPLRHSYSSEKMLSKSFTKDLYDSNLISKEFPISRKKTFAPKKIEEKEGQEDGTDRDNYKDMDDDNKVNKEKKDEEIDQDQL